MYTSSRYTSVDAGASLGASLRELTSELQQCVCTASNTQATVECKAWQGDRCKANHGFTRTLHALND